MRRLLFDFGGVVIKTPFEMLHRVESPSWFGPFDSAADALWQEMRGGRISEREYWHRRASELFPGAEDPSRELIGIVFAPSAEEVVRPEIQALVAEASGRLC